MPTPFYKLFCILREPSERIISKTSNQLIPPKTHPFTWGKTNRSVPVYLGALDITESHFDCQDKIREVLILNKKMYVGENGSPTRMGFPEGPSLLSELQLNKILFLGVF